MTRNKTGAVLMCSQARLVCFLIRVRHLRVIRTQFTDAFVTHPLTWDLIFLSFLQYWDGFLVYIQRLIRRQVTIVSTCTNVSSGQLACCLTGSPVRTLYNLTLRLIYLQIQLPYDFVRLLTGLRSPRVPV